MKVHALDHVNIITDDLDRSARFYEDLLNLERRDAPAPMTPQMAQWMFNEDGQAIMHLNSPDCPRAYDREVARGPSGSIHHVAFNCSGFDETVTRLEAIGMEWQTNTIDSIGLRQIFIMDPHEVLLELNFFAD